MSWFASLEVPVLLPGRRQIRTLDEARAWLVSLPNADVNSDEFSTAVRALNMAADGRCPMTEAHLAILDLLKKQNSP